MQEWKPSPNRAGKQYCLNCHASNSTTENGTPSAFPHRVNFTRAPLSRRVTSAGTSSSSGPLSDCNKGKRERSPSVTSLPGRLVGFPSCQSSGYRGRVTWWPTRKITNGLPRHCALGGWPGSPEQTPREAAAARPWAQAS